VCAATSSGTEVAKRAARAVRPDRLANRLAELATYGARPDGGVCRLALGAQDRDARRYLIEVARANGLDVSRDEAANVFFRRPGTTTSPPVATGSHIDTQPAGGKLDGAFGVCAGLEALAALDDAEVVTRRPLEVAIWTNEEGCRFAPASMGASAFVEPELLIEHKLRADADGVSVASELACWDQSAADVPLRELAQPMHAFIEAHIEQGPILENAGVPLGVVSGIQGVRWIEIEIKGHSAHAGTTPRGLRHDALEAATQLLSKLYRLAEAGDADLRLTVGRLEIEPGSINSIPGRLRMTVDIRHPDDAILSAVTDGVLALAHSNVHSCVASAREIMTMAAVEFPRTLRSTLTEAVRLLDIPWTEIASGAFHDSLHIARHCPTAMLFAPSIGGVSHHPAEMTAPAHLVDVTRALTATLVQLAEVAE
jgi:N-carbamoyl-L-amino-acid hydrolase